MRLKMDYPSKVWDAWVAAIEGDLTVLQFDFSAEDKSHEVVFTVDGVELNFERVIESMHKSLDFNIETQAKRMFEEKLETLSSAVHRVTENMLEECKRLLPNADWERESW